MFTHPNPFLKHALLNKSDQEGKPIDSIVESLQQTLSFSLRLINNFIVLSMIILKGFNSENEEYREKLREKIYQVFRDSNKGYFTEKPLEI